MAEEEEEEEEEEKPKPKAKKAAPQEECPQDRGSQGGPEGRRQEGRHQGRVPRAAPKQVNIQSLIMCMWNWCNGVLQCNMSAACGRSGSS